MKYALLLLMFFSYGESNTIINFTSDSEIKNWKIVDDVVMGGRSSGHFNLTEEGYGKFSGNVSLENNGGFSSVRYIFPKKDVNNYSTIKVKLKGDGKNYQLRIKPDARDYHAYITTFKTSGNWEEIEIDLKDFFPSLMGRKLDIPNYDGEEMEEISFLIANYKNESFELLIDKIELN